MNIRRPIIMLLVVAILLLVPLIAMQFTDEVVWTASDFVVMGLLLLGTGLLLEIILRKVTKPKHRIIFGVLIIIFFLLFWAELAVGIFGTLFEGN